MLRLHAFCIVLVIGATNLWGQSTTEWAISNVEAYQIDRTALDRAYTHAEAMQPLSSLLIARYGNLVAEHYFRGATARQQVNIKSASKSVLGILFGIAVDEGYFPNLDAPISTWFPDYYAQDDIPPAKRAITLHHLLTMTPGLETTSFQNYGAWVSSRNWATYALDQPIVHTPGGDAMVYSTGTTHLISVILSKATGQSTLAWAREKLFRPMGIALPSWDRDPQGFYLGGNNMALTPRQLLAIGQLYLDGGSYEGRQLVSPEWIKHSTTRYVNRSYRGFHYGYFWWLEDFGGYDTWFAWGYGGQYVFIIPELDLVVACTSALTGRPRGVDHNARIYELLEHYVLPAVLPNPAVSH